MAPADPLLIATAAESGLRRHLLDARIARRVLALVALCAWIGALVIWLEPPAQRSAHPVAETLMWCALGLLAAGLYPQTDQRVQTSFAPFLSAMVAALMGHALLHGQHLNAPGVVALPLLLLVAALLISASAARLLTAGTCAGLILLAFEPLGARPMDAAWSTHSAHLTSLVMCSVCALMLGRFLATRFAAEVHLSARHEYRYRDLFDRIPSAVVLHDNGRVLDANRAALALFGRGRRDELLGHDLRRYLTGPDHVARFESRMDRLATMAAGETLPMIDFPIRNADGRNIPVRATATALHDLAIGSPDARDLAVADAQRRCLSFIVDDTERHRAQAEVTRTRVLLDAIVAHSPYAMALSRIDDATIVECNDAFTRLVERSRAQLLNTVSLELSLWPEPGHRTAILESLSSQADAVDRTFSLRRPSGHLRTVKGTGTRVLIDGVDHLLLMGRDITDSQLRDAVHEAIVDVAPVGLAITYGGRVVTANPELHRIFECEPGSLVGHTTRRLWRDRAAHEAREAQMVREFAIDGRTRFEQTFEVGQRTILVLIQGRLVSTPGQDLPTVVWIMEDITQQRDAEHRLQTAAQQAEQASRAKSLFLANMSHELRTPLNGILGLLDMVLDGSDGDGSRRHIELARESARVLTDLLTDILDVTKIEAGRLRVDEAPFDLQALLDSLESVYRVLAEPRGLFLRFDRGDAPAGPWWVHGDALRVRQILTNYLTNALKFTEAGGVELIVRRLPSGGPMRLEVRDSGPGIEPAVQARLFRRFEQGDASPTRRIGGSGLGLSICRDLATLMGGAVGLSSTVGRGTTFWVQLPLPPAEPGVPAAAAVEADEAFPALRVLVADDNPINSMIAEAALQRVQARVTGVANGRAALEAVAAAQAEGDPYDLVFMDIQMPELDGLEATRELRRLHDARELPIIALTAGALQAERDAALAAGMNDFITKPLERQALIECLTRWRAAAPATS